MRVLEESSNTQNQIKRLAITLDGTSGMETYIYNFKSISNY